MAELGISGDEVVKILQLGAPGLAFVLAFLAFLAVQKAPKDLGDNDLTAYKIRARTVNRLLIANVAIFLAACALQYILAVKESRVYVVVQEHSQFARLALQPIQLRHRADEPVSIPGEKMIDRALLKLRDDDQLDVSLRPLIDRITDLHLQLNAHAATAASRSREGGFDDAR